MKGMYDEAGNSKADIWQDPNPLGSSPIEQKGGSSFGASENSGGPRAEAAIADSTDKKGNVDWDKIWSMVKKGGLAIGDLMDVIGSAKQAYAGVNSPTRLQQQFRNRLVMEQQAAQSKSAAEAEISKYDPQTRAKIKQIQAEYEANGDMQKAVADYTYEMELGKITQTTYAALLKAMQAKNFTPGGPEAAGRALATGGAH
jgi:hypothetical protein